MCGFLVLIGNEDGNEPSRFGKPDRTGCRGWDLAEGDAGGHPAPAEPQMVQGSTARARAEQRPGPCHRHCHGLGPFPRMMPCSGRTEGSGAAVPGVGSLQGCMGLGRFSL